MVLDEDPMAGIPLSTVYRTLGDLREMRLVAEVGAGTGKSTYEWVNVDEPHHHLVCQRCEREFELSSDLLGALGDEVRKECGFESFLDHLVLQGVCADCRADAEER